MSKELQNFTWRSLQVPLPTFQALSPSQHEEGPTGISLSLALQFQRRIVRSSRLPHGDP